MFYIAIIKRELKLTIRCSLIHIITLFTLMLSISIFTIDMDIHEKLLPTLLWLCITFTLHSSMYHLFDNDYQNGILEQILIQGYNLELIILSKIVAYWLCLCLPISIISILITFITLGNIYYACSIGILLSINSLIIIFISSLGNALTIDKSGGSTIAQIIIIPLIVPVLIYFNLLSDSIRTYTFNDDLLLLSALIVCLIPISVFFTATAIKLTIENN